MLILEYCTKQMDSLLGYLILSFNVFKNLNHTACHEEQCMLILYSRGQQTLWKGPSSQYFRLCGLSIFYCNYSTLLLKYKNSHRQYVNE